MQTPPRGPGFRKKTGTSEVIDRLSTQLDTLLPKLRTRVRFPSPAPSINAGDPSNYKGFDESCGDLESPAVSSVKRPKAPISGVEAPTKRPPETLCASV